MPQPDFDRFLLQGAFSPEEEKKSYTGEFSFSAGKYRLFCFCERAWYFHYILAQGGWDRYADPLSCQAYREKYLLSYPAFLSGVFLSSIEKSLPVIREETKEYCRMEKLLDAMKYHASREIFLSLNFLRTGGMEKDPRKLSFLDLYYDTGKFANFEELIECCKDSLRHIFRFLPETKYFSFIASLPAPAWRRAEKFPSFTLDGLCIYLAPSLYALSGGHFYSFPLYFHKEAEKSDTLYNTLSALYTQKKYPGHKGKNFALFFDEKENVCCEKEVETSVENQENIFIYAEKMMKKLQDPRMENFPCTEEKEKCSFCRFRGVCKKSNF